MRTVINGEQVYCASSGRWMPGHMKDQRATCPECGERVLVTRVSALRTHFAPYKVGPDGKRLPEMLL